MRLAEALQVIGRETEGAKRQVVLLCGFEPMHLATFLKAHLLLRFPGEGVSVHSGLYGDLEGNIERAAREVSADGAVLIVEWSDLDPRLGFRNSAHWDASTPDEIIDEVADKCGRLLERITHLAAAMPVTIVGPTLDLSLFTHLPPAQTSSYELTLNSLLLDMFQRLCRLRGVKLFSASILAVSSPLATRLILGRSCGRGSRTRLVTPTSLGNWQWPACFRPRQKKA